MDMITEEDDINVWLKCKLSGAMQDFLSRRFYFTAQET